MKNNKFSPTPPLVENNKIVNDPAEKCEIFNTFFASKSTVNGAMDEPPCLTKTKQYRNFGKNKHITH